MNLRKREILLPIFLNLFFVVSCTSKKGELIEPMPTSASSCDSITVTYAGSIKAIIENNCINPGCHGSAFSSGDLRQHSGIKAKVDNGSLSDRVIVKKNMPSFGISADDIQKIQCWIEAGAPNN